MRRAALLGSIIALVCASPAYADSGLVGSWPFDEGSGTVVHDASSHGNDGTISGDVQWVSGFSGTALSFDGNTGRVRIPDSPSLDPSNAVTVGAWVRASLPQGAFNYIVAKGASGCLAASYGLYTGPNGGLVFYVAQNRGLSYTRSPDRGAGVWNGTWHFVVGTYDGGSVRLYVDGSQVGKGTSHSGPIDYNFPDNELFIGHYNACPAEDFHGQVDQAQIWNRALNASEVRSQYDAQTSTGQAGTPASSAPDSTPTSGGDHSSSSPSSPTYQPTGADQSTLGRVSLDGLTAGKPNLVLRLLARPGTTPIKSFTLSLPNGLAFSHNLALIRHGVSVTHAGAYKLSLSRGKLVVVLNRPTRSLAVMIRSPALAEGHGLVERARGVVSFNRNKKHQKKRVLKLKMTLRLTDSVRQSEDVGAVALVS